MARPPRIPEALAHGPFDHREAAEHGVTERMLRGDAWRRIHPRVWVHADHQMTHDEDLRAAELTMPDTAHLSHASRLQRLGLDLGEHAPIHFTVAGDLHLATPGIFLHRTEVLPPVDEHGVTPAVAFIQFCASATLIDAIAAGDWLLHRRHATTVEIAEIAHLHRWRPGAEQALRVLPHLDGRSRSVRESQLRCRIVFSGLPAPEVNAPLFDGSQQFAIADLLFRVWMLIVEYEGRQHALSTEQFQRDVWRYGRVRETGHEYLQVTDAMAQHPRALMMRLHRMLVARGYEGPPPTFGPRWEALSAPIWVPRPSRRAVSERRSGVA